MSSNTDYPKVCVHCGTHFIAKKISTQYCSHKCASHAYKQKKRAEKVAIAKIEVKNHTLPPIIHQEKHNHIKPSDSNLSILKEKEFLSVAEVSQLIGIGYTTTYNYCISGKLKCIKMNRKIFIRRSDIDELFNSTSTYEVTPRVQHSQETNSKGVSKMETPITDFISAKEAGEIFGVTKDAIHARARTQKTPWVLFQKIKLYSRSHLEQLYKDDERCATVTEWQNIEEIMEQYSMTKNGVYSFVSENKIPRKNVNRRNIYSKSHIDKILKSRLGDATILNWYTVEDIYEKYGLKSNYIANFVFVNKIPKRRVNSRGEYSMSHFDKAIKQCNPSTVYLKIEDAAIQFKLSEEKIHTLINQHDIPTTNDGKYIRVQKTELELIINPPKLYIENGN